MPKYGWMKFKTSYDYPERDVQDILRGAIRNMVGFGLARSTIADPVDTVDDCRRCFHSHACERHKYTQSRGIGVCSCHICGHSMSYPRQGKPLHVVHAPRRFKCNRNISTLSSTLRTRSPTHSQRADQRENEALASLLPLNLHSYTWWYHEIRS